MDYKKDNKHQEVNTPEPDNNEYAKVNNCTHLNVRKTPEAEGDVLLVITDQDTVIIQRVVNDEWSKIIVSDVEGFVMSEYLTEVN